VPAQAFTLGLLPIREIFKVVPVRNESSFLAIESRFSGVACVVNNPDQDTLFRAIEDARRSLMDLDQNRGVIM
jgi:hypothetical protein